MCPSSLISVHLSFLPSFLGAFPHFNDFWLGGEKAREQDRSNRGRKIERDRVDNKREREGHRQTEPETEATQRRRPRESP